MKKNFLILLIGIFIYAAASSQSIVITGNCKKNITTSGNITLNPSGTTLVLNNVTLDCNKVIFSSALNTIQIIGKVKIICKGGVEFSTPVGPANIALTGALSTSSLILEYPETIPIPSTRSFEIQSGSNVELVFISK